MVIPPFLIKFALSKIGPWALAGILALALVATWKIQQWRLEACAGRLAAIEGELRTAVGVNERNAATIRELTAAKTSAEAARDAAVAIAAERKVEVITRTNTIVREVERATTQNECPVAPSLRAALAGLREFGAARRDGDGVPGRAPTATGGPVRLRPAPPPTEP